MHPAVERYLLEVGREEDPLLDEMDRVAEVRQFPVVGRLVGRVLRQLARLSGARRVFEIGSGFGYSAYWFLLGMPPDGRIVLTDRSAENLGLARDFLKRAGFEGRADFVRGDGVEVLRSREGPFDLIFFDHEKERYPEALDVALARLRRGGLLAADNVLWFGRPLDARERGPDVEGIREFTRGIFSRPGLITSILPIRDGLSVTIGTEDRDG